MKTEKSRGIAAKLAAAVLAVCLAMCAAGSMKNVKAEEEQESAGYPAYSHSSVNPYYAPVCGYLLENFGPLFEPEDITLPIVILLREDDSDPDDIKVWGRFAVMNYALRGTTLLTRSGGDFSGLIHLEKDGEGYKAVAMDRLEDGSDNDASVKRIFGVDEELLAGYRESYADRMDATAEAVRWYSEDTGIDIQAYEDYGWDPVYVNPENQPSPEYPDIEGTWSTDGVEMKVTAPDEGSVYEAEILVDQEDGSVLKYELYGQYEVSTDALYYWDGWVSRETGTGSEDLGSEEEGELDLQDDGSIIWNRADDTEGITLKRES